jgi:hypothetical protein
VKGFRILDFGDWIYEKSRVVIFRIKHPASVDSNSADPLEITKEMGKKKIDKGSFNK